MTAFGKNPYFEGEVVSTLATQHAGKEFVDWIQIDGPGSGNLQDHLLWTRPGEHWDKIGKTLGYGLQVNVRHALAVIKNEFDESEATGLHADYISYDKEGEEVARTPALIKSHGKKLRDSGALTGITPQLLQQQIARMGRKTNNGKVSQVNLIGWSRGAVTCIAIANAISKDKTCQNIKVNIFAVDPVPGAYAEAFSWGKTEIPDCVEEYFGVYARDEVSVGFSPVIPRLLSNKTKITLLPMPGMHASVAGNSHIDKESKKDAPFNTDVGDVGRITRYWAEQCLKNWGVKMRRTANYSDSMLLQFYLNILGNDAIYRGMQKYSYTGVRQGNFSVFRKFYISGSGLLSNYWSLAQLGNDPRYSQMQMMFKDHGERIFVNWHHRDLFLKQMSITS